MNIRTLIWAGDSRGLKEARATFRASLRLPEDRIEVASAYMSYASDYIGGSMLQKLQAAVLGLAANYHARRAVWQASLETFSANELSVLSANFGKSPPPFGDLRFAKKCASRGITLATRQLEDVLPSTLALLYADWAKWEVRLNRDWAPAEMYASKAILLEDQILMEKDQNQARAQFSRVLSDVGVMHRDIFNNPTYGNELIERGLEYARKTSAGQERKITRKAQN